MVEDIWKNVLDYIKEEVSQQVFDIWFKPIEFITFKDNFIKLGVPNNFFKGWLIEHYLLIIKKALLMFSNTKGDINISIIILDQPGLVKKDDSSQPGFIDNNKLSSRYTFDNFVVGPSNQFAHAAALAVADFPAENYNPLFIYGGVGLGKTHLLNSVGHQLLKTKKVKRIGCLSAEEFMNELITSIRFDKMTKFRNKYRNLDILLIDDIQFIGGKERTQVEFFHTFNSLYENHKQIAITSDVFPKEIAGLEERLSSRFSWGLIADIQPPEIETKIAILKKKVSEHGISLPNDVLFFLASLANSNIRELEGLLIRVLAFASLTKSRITQITVESVEEVLKDLIPNKNKEIKVGDILSVVSSFFNIKISDIKSQKRLKSFSQPRQIAMYLMRNLTSHSLSEIGNFFGGKDHSTVLYAIKKIEKNINKDSYLMSSVNSIKIRLGV